MPRILLREVSFENLYILPESRYKTQMGNQRTSIVLTGIFILAVLILIGLTWTNYRFAVLNPGGNDFLPQWVGTRLFLTKGWSPYSSQTTREIHKITYGRLTNIGEDQVLFVSPFYSIVVFAPFGLVSDYTLARALWMTTLEVALAALAVASITISRWKPSRWMLLLLLLFTLLWYHSVRPVVNGNASVICALLIALVFVSIRSGQDTLAGMLLALTTIKPQMVILLIPFVLLWAYSHSRWVLIWSTVGGLGFLVAGTSLLLSDWLIQNLRQVLSYPNYTLPGTPGAILSEWLPGVGSQMGWVLTIFLVIVLLWEWRLAWGKGYRRFLWAASLTLVITNLIGIRTATANYVAMFPALILVLAMWEERWGRAGRWLVAFCIIILFFGLWWLFLATVQIGDQAIQDPIMFFPLPIFLFLGLYWVRWWAIGPPRLMLEQVRINLGEELE